MHNVEIYTSDTCGYCHAAKEFFNENGVQYTEHNISKDAEAKRSLIKKGYMSVPIIIIDGEEIQGFNQDKISGLLNV